MKEMRIQQILQILHEHDFVTVEELVDQIGVSASTVRRDLGELARRGLVICGHNGAIPVSEMQADASVSFRSGVNAKAKANIARRAAHIIQNGSMVFLDSSSTVLNMTDYMRTKKNIVVVTNSLLVVSRLQGSEVTVHMIGGIVSPISYAFYGPLTEEALREYNFDYAFISPVCITDQGYASETTEIAADIRAAALRRTRCGVLLCDHSKMGQYRAYNIAHVNSFQYIVTDGPLPVADTTATVIRI
jgi:DeoR/GlpR family transcriptional regulator of sugar metabolism